MSCQRMRFAFHSPPRTRRLSGVMSGEIIAPRKRGSSWPVKTGPADGAVARWRGPFATVMATSSNWTRPLTASSPRINSAAVASAGMAALNGIRFQSNVPETLFCCGQASPPGEVMCSMNLMPFHGWGGCVTPSAFTMARQKRRHPRIFSIGSGILTVLPAAAGLSISRDCALAQPGAIRADWFCPAPHSRCTSAPSKPVWKMMSPGFDCAMPVSVAARKPQAKTVARGPGAMR